MLKANKKTLILTSVITLLPILVGLYFWKQLPDRMATHFGTNNVADGFTGKAFAVFGMPLILLAVQWFAAVVTSNDPKKQNISPKLFTLVLWIIPAVSLFTAFLTYSYSLGYRMDIGLVCMLLLSVLLIVIGNYMPKARQSYTVGIRLPWTLANEENWNRTHRLAGWLWIAAGFALLVLTLFRVFSLVALIAVSVVIILIPTLYSFWLHVAKGL